MCAIDLWPHVATRKSINVTTQLFIEGMIVHD